MSQKITLENIDEIGSLHRTDFYKLITGEECKFNFGSTEVDSWKDNVRSDNMELIMKVVDKFDKRHGSEGYYGGCVERIREAYTKKDYEKFSQEIGELLVSINWD